MEIKAGQYYRRKNSDHDRKLLACHDLGNERWDFYAVPPRGGNVLWELSANQVEPWTDPPKLVPHWPVVVSHFGRGYGIDWTWLLSKEPEAWAATKYEYVRLATEYPAIMLETKD